VSAAYYLPATQTVANQGGFEGVAVVPGLIADSPIVMQFNLPEVIPSGLMKLRTLVWSNAVSGTAYWTISDGETPASSSIGTASLTNENGGNTYSRAWASSSPDLMLEDKAALSTVPVANDILTVLFTFKVASQPSRASWSLGQASVWQFSLIWE
jgi:hypothetical protein